MTISGRFIIEVTVDGCQKWYNGAKPFVDDINKAFICPDKKSLDKNIAKITSFWGYPCKAISLSITAI